MTLTQVKKKDDMTGELIVQSDENLGNATEATLPGLLWVKTFVYVHASRAYENIRRSSLHIDWPSSNYKKQLYGRRRIKQLLGLDLTHFLTLLTDVCMSLMTRLLDLVRNLLGRTVEHLS